MLTPQWPSPDNIRSLITTRTGGVSLAPYANFNLGEHVGDASASVSLNRGNLESYVGAKIEWLTQVHGTQVADLSGDPCIEVAGDSAITRERRRVCAVMAADCLPILLCDDKGEQVAAVHAGWRGLAAGIVEQTLARFEQRPERIYAYLGPAISQTHFEVGEDVVEAFLAAEKERPYSEPSAKAFKRGSGEGKFFADIYGLARAELNGAGIKGVYGGDYCTYSDRVRFYSYRRDGVTGRMASLIWLD
ncbi:MAG: YfiH family protein [Lentisphaeria bacterium]|jgi:YfiH family protein